MDETKEKLFEDLRTPNTFFCTFMEGEGKYAALQHEKMDFDGIKVAIKECKNPSDIIWLNRGVPRKEQLIRGAAVLLIIGMVATIIYFMFSLEIAAQMYINYRANPPNVICDELFRAYTVEGV